MLVTDSLVSLMQLGSAVKLRNTSSFLSQFFFLVKRTVDGEILFHCKQ